MSKFSLEKISWSELKKERLRCTRMTESCREKCVLFHFKLTPKNCIFRGGIRMEKECPKASDTCLRYCQTFREAHPPRRGRCKHEALLLRKIKAMMRPEK